MNRKTLNITLIGILILVAVVAAYVWYSRSNQVVVTKNPLTGQTEISGGSAPSDPNVVKETDYTPTLLSDQTIFDKGLLSSEYHAIIRALDKYTKQEYGDKRHITYTIDSSTVEFNQENSTFSFRMEVEKNSRNFFDVTVQRPQFNNLDITLRDDDEVIYNQKMKVNERL